MERCAYGMPLKGKKSGLSPVHTKSVLSVVFSPDGKRLASIDDDDELRLWDVENQQEIATLTGDNWWETRSASFSPVRDSKLLASGGDDGMVRLWDVDTGAEIAVIPGPADGVTSVSFSPDGKTLAATGIAGWEKTGRLAHGTGVFVGCRHPARKSPCFADMGLSRYMGQMLL